MKSIAIKDLSENFFEVIGKEWMLVTAGSKEHFNTMTASWGGIGWLWNKPVVFVFIRSERYTYEFMEENEYFTLSFLGKENRGNILFEQDRLGLECRKLFITDMKEELFLDHSVYERWYGGDHGGLHRVYVAEIVDAWVKE